MYFEPTWRKTDHISFFTGELAKHEAVLSILNISRIYQSLGGVMILKKNTIIFLKSLTIISFLFFLVSCIGIETEIEFKNSNSGTVKLKYRVSKMVINTAQIDSDSSFLLFQLRKMILLKNLVKMKI